MKEWVRSAGSPLLLLPKILQDDWDGIEISPDREVEAKFRWDKNGPATDFDRACDVEAYVGVIQVGSGEGVVLGDEANITSWYPLENTQSGVLVRWVYAENLDSVVKHIQSIVPSELEWESEGIVNFTSTSLILFDSALPGCGIEETAKVVLPGYEKDRDFIKIDLKAGSYNIKSCYYEPDKKTSLLLIILELVGRN